jgi:hypothetical protein
MRWRPLLLGGLAFGVLTACAVPRVPFLQPAKAVRLHSPCEQVSVPVAATVDGYSVTEETAIAKQFCTDDPTALITGGTLYSFRLGKTLYATLEVAKLKPGVNAKSSGFQQNVVGQIGSSVMRPRKYGTQVVWLGTANRGAVFCWFKGSYLHVLLTHDIKDPDPLLQAVLPLP